MLFTNFIQSQDGLTITLRNYDALLNVKDIKFYQEVVSGSFTKKEFRWAFVPNHWSSWQELTPGNFSSINPRNRPTIFFEIRYVLSNLKSGKVTSFVINYTVGATITTDSNVITRISIPKKVEPIIINIEPIQEKPPEKVIPVIIETPPAPGYDSSTAVEIPENIPKYANENEPVVTPKNITIVNANALDGKSSGFYLWRPYHKGTQEIKTIQGLQSILNNLTNGLQNSIFKGKNVEGAGIGVMYNSTAHELLFKRLNAGSGMIISESPGGIISFEVDIAAASRDPSTDELFDITKKLDASIIDLQLQITDISIYIDSKFFEIDASLNLKANINYVDSYNIIQDGSLLLLQNYDISIDASIVRIEGYQTTQDASINKINNYQNIQDASILINNNNIYALDASIVRIDLYNVNQDLTISIIQSNIINIEASLAYLDASISNITNITESLDASISRIDNYNSIQDTSISILDINIQSIDVSIIGINLYNTIQDISINTLEGSILNIDTSIQRLDNYNSIQDVSISINKNNILELDASIQRIDTYQIIQDASLVNAYTILDSSISRIDIYNNMQDSSISVLDTSISRIDIYNAIQDVSIAAGVGGVTLEYVDGSLNDIRATYIPDASLSSDFVWIGGFLTVDVSSAGGGVKELEDYSTYEPHPGDVSIYRINDNVSQIITKNSFGIKVVDFSYDINGDVNQIDISTYGLISRIVTFDKNINGDIIAVHIA